MLIFSIYGMVSHQCNVLLNSCYDFGVILSTQRVQFGQVHAFEDI